MKRLILFILGASIMKKRDASPSEIMEWRDAVRGARRGLEYLDLLRDIWASELTSH